MRFGETHISPQFALWAVILLNVAFRLVVSVGWDATIDETYHYLYTTHPDLSYFDHPPMTAWIAKAGLFLCGGADNTFSLRLGFVLTFAAATWVLARWTERWFGPWAGVYAAILLNLSGYYAAIGGFAIPDVPSVFFSLLTMWALSEALVEQPGRVWPWVWVGLAFGGAMLSKYYAVFLPMSAFLFILLTPGTRRVLLTPGPYLAFAIGIAMFTPVLMWNASHEWASFRFQGGRSASFAFKPTGPKTAIFGPFLLLFPWVWYLLIRPLVSRLWHFGSVGGVERLIVCLSLVPLGIFGGLSCFRWLMIHWPIIGFLPLFPLAGATWANWAAVDPLWSRRRIACMSSVVLAVAAVSISQCQFGLLSVAGKDPLEYFARAGTVVGGSWESVGEELHARGFVGKPNTFLVTPSWSDSAQLAYSIRERSPVLCYDDCDARGFAFWSTPEEWVGWDGLLVIPGDDPDPRALKVIGQFFTEVTLVAEFRMTRGGVPSRTIRVWECKEQRCSFPFSYQNPGR